MPDACPGSTPCGRSSAWRRIRLPVRPWEGSYAAILKIAESNVPGILDDLDTEFLHDYRICLRKVRSVLSLVKDVYPAEGTGRMRKILGDLARQTNRLRDLDVYLLARDEYRELVPPALRPAPGRDVRGFFGGAGTGGAARGREAARGIQPPASPGGGGVFLRRMPPMNPHRPPTSPWGRWPSAASTDVTARSAGWRPGSGRRRRRGGAPAPYRVQEAPLPHGILRRTYSQGRGGRMLGLLRRLQNRLGEFNDALGATEILMNYWERKRPVRSRSGWEGSWPSSTNGSGRRAAIERHWRTSAAAPTAATLQTHLQRRGPPFPQQSA